MYLFSVSCVLSLLTIKTVKRARKFKKVFKKVLALEFAEIFKELEETFILKSVYLILGRKDMNPEARHFKLLQKFLGHFQGKWSVQRHLSFSGPWFQDEMCPPL